MRGSWLPKDQQIPCFFFLLPYKLLGKPKNVLIRDANIQRSKFDQIREFSLLPQSSTVKF